MTYYQKFSELKGIRLHNRDRIVLYQKNLEINELDTSITLHLLFLYSPPMTI